MGSKVSVAAVKAVRHLKNKLALLKRRREACEEPRSDEAAEEKTQIKVKLASLARKIKRQVG